VSDWQVLNVWPWEPPVFRHAGQADRPTVITDIATLAEMYKDPMPASLFWRMVNYANRSPERRTHAKQLSRDSSYATGAWCLLNWIQDNKDRFDQWHAVPPRLGSFSTTETV
jgi:hypothetical protein